MRKGFIKVAVIIVVLLIVLIFLPFIVGIVVKNNTNNILRSVLMTPKIKAEVVSYDRGWFHSSAVVKISIPETMDANAKPLSFEVKEVVGHGPFVHTASGWDFAKAAIVITSMSKDYPLNISGSLSFANNLTASAKVSSWKFFSKTKQSGSKTKQSGSLDNWQSLFKSNISSGVSTVSSRVDNLMFKLPMQGKQRKDQDQDITMNVKNAHGHSDFNVKNPWLNARGKSVVGEMTIGSGKHINVIRHIVMHTHSIAKNDVFGMGFDLTALSLETAAAGKFSHIVISASANGLSVSKLTSLTTLLHKFNAATGQERKELSQSVNAALMSALANNLDLQIKKFSVITPQGPFDLNLDLKLPKQGTTTPSYFVILAAMQADLNVNMTKTWLHKVLTAAMSKQDPSLSDAQSKLDKLVPKTEQAMNRINNWIKDGALIADGNNLKIHLEYHDGQLKVNDKPFSMLGGGS
jgi:hypothetical protein